MAVVFVGRGRGRRLGHPTKREESLRSATGHRETVTRSISVHRQSLLISFPLAANNILYFLFNATRPGRGGGAKTKKEDKACRRRPASGHRTASAAVGTSPIPRRPLLSTQPLFSSPDTSNAHPRLAGSRNLRRTQTRIPPKKEASRSCEFPAFDLSSALSSSCSW